MTPTKLPDGPKTPVFIQRIQALIDQPGLLEQTSAKYGDIFYIPKSWTLPPFVIFSNPEAIKKVFTANPNIFEVSQQSLAPIKALLGDNSLFVIDGLKHQRIRKLLMPPFHGERMKNYAQTIIDITKTVLESWEVGQPFAMQAQTQDISLEVILHTIFGLENGAKYEQLKKLLTEWVNIFNSPWRSFLLFFPFLQKDLGSWSPWGKFIRKKKLIYKILQGEIEQKRNISDNPGKDILSLMLSAQDEEGQPLSDEEIRDELLTLLFAGHETTAHTLGWSFYWIYSLPEVKEKLMNEINSLEDIYDFNTITKLPYLSAVISETLRLNPIVLLIARQLKEPFELMGYTFEQGTSLFPSIYLTHQREDIYPEPKKFKPERFLEKQFSPYEYLPFGGGNRQCLGYAFSLFEMKLVLATILYHTELELIESKKIKPVRRGILVAPSDDINMRLIRKK